MKTRTALTSVLAALGLVTAWQSPALAGDPPQLTTHTCPNGLQIVVVERHAAPLVTIEIGVHNGAMAEPPAYNGLSHLYEHMFFKGNKVMPDQEAYLERLRELGMTFNGTTDNERVNYFFTTTSDHYVDAMSFMRDAIVTPSFDAKELERERVVVTGEIDRNESDPGYYFWHETARALYGNLLSRKDALGARSTVLTATTEKLRTIQHRYYVPNNSTLIVTGDVNAADVFKRADDLYKDWAKAPDPFVKFPLVKFPPLAHSEVLVVKEPVQTFTGSFTWHGPSTGDASVAQSYAADLLGAMVGNPASKFQHALVDSGLCVRAGFGWQTQKNDGPIGVDYEATPDKIDACTQAVVAELGKLGDPTYFADEEMKNAATTLDVHLAHERETTEGLAHQLTYFWTSATFDYYQGYLAKVRAVTRDDIGKFLTTWVTKKPFVFSAMESPDLAAKVDAKHLAGLVGVKATDTKTVTPESSSKPGDKKPASAANAKTATTKDAKKAVTK